MALAAVRTYQVGGFMPAGAQFRGAVKIGAMRWALRGKCVSRREVVMQIADVPPALAVKVREVPRQLRVDDLGSRLTFEALESGQFFQVHALRRHVRWRIVAQNGQYADQEKKVQTVRHQRRWLEEQSCQGVSAAGIVFVATHA